jgi:hypothetical protein
VKALSIFALVILAAACGSEVAEIPPAPAADIQTAPPETAHGSVDEPGSVANPQGATNGSSDVPVETNDGPVAHKCSVKVAAADVYCSDNPLGNTKSECAKFGLKAASKDDSLEGTSAKASRNAYVAIVKSGTHGCEPGDAAYRIYVDVKKGDTLLTPRDQDISHITYCACPVAP